MRVEFLSLRVGPKVEGSWPQSANCCTSDRGSACWKLGPPRAGSHCNPLTTLQVTAARGKYSPGFELWPTACPSNRVMPRLKVRERRQWERIGLAVPLFVRGVDDRGLEFLEFGTALNISAGGALLAVQRPLPRAKRVSVETPSLPSPENSPTPFAQRLKARVTRVMPSHGYTLCGLKFSRPLNSH